MEDHAAGTVDVLEKQASKSAGDASADKKYTL
jgi:hypothetical protein